MAFRALLRLLALLVVLAPIAGIGPLAAAPAAARTTGSSPDEVAAFMFPYLNEYWFTEFFGSDDGLDYDLLVEYHLYDSQFDWILLHRCPLPIGDDNGVYCHVEQAIFLDRQLMETLSSTYGPWTTAHALAHEWGHHIEWTLAPDAYDAGFTNPVIRKGMELLADCFAGAALRPLYDRGSLLPADVESMRRLSSYLGDDRGTGLPPPPGFVGVHGTGAERVAAFDRGFVGGRFESCVAQ